MQVNRKTKVGKCFGLNAIDGGYLLATILKTDVQISVHRQESQVVTGAVNNDHRTEEEALAFVSRLSLHTVDFLAVTFVSSSV